MFPISGKGLTRLLVAGASLANGLWTSLAQTSVQGHGSAAPVLLAVASVWAGYLSLAWLFQGMRS